jgi:hypothetical protein
MAGIEPPTSNKGIKVVVAGIRRSIGTSVTRKAPATAETVRVMDVIRHREVSTLKTYDRRAKAFNQHAGDAFL